MFHEYLDCEIEIQPRNGDIYPFSIRVLGGDARGSLRLPTDDPTYQALVGKLATLQANEEDLTQIGQLLFTALFQGPVKEVLVRSQGRLQPEQGLRLILSIATTEQEVGALPWEFLYDPDQGPLAMLDTSIIRYLQQSALIPKLKTDLPLRMLLTGAQPGELPKINVERELSEIQTALADLVEQRRIQLKVEPHLTHDKLQQLLRQGFHIWHFAGHGSFGRDGRTAALAFEDAQGDLAYVNASELGILLNRSVHLIVLDACESGRLTTEPFRSIAPALIRGQIPAVIAMQFSVPDASARAFAGEFYRALAEGFPIDACVTEGRKAVMLASGRGQPDWGIPVVYSRALDGKLFDLPVTAAPVASDDRRPIRDSFLALRTLMETPAVYAAVASGRDQFQDVLRQINTLGRYKGLHDRLQQLEDSAWIIEGDQRRLPQDQRAWGDLARSVEDLYGKIDAVLDLAADAPADRLWTDKLKRGQQESRTGVEQGDLNLLASAMNRIDDVLGRMPSIVNTRLVQIAKDLLLGRLVQNLATVVTRLDMLDLDEWATRQYDVFAQGVTALERLDERLGQLVLRHDLFQNLDNELRRVEIGLDPGGRALVLAWPDLQPLHLQVCDDQTAVWAPRLVATAAELEQSLAAPGSQRTVMIFGRYRGQVSQSFNYVDADLLKLCEELQGISKSLEFVLRTVP